MSTSPTQLSLQFCRRQGWPCRVLEHGVYIPTGETAYVPALRRIARTFAMAKRRDLFGFIDGVALDGQPGLLGWQATSATNVAARVRKAEGSEFFAAWLAAGNRFEVWGWAQAKPGARWRRIVRAPGAAPADA